MGEAGGGVGLAERAEEEAEGVAQLAVDFVGEAAEQGEAGDNVFAEVDGGDPEADDVASEGVHDGDGIDEVAEGLAECAALLVERPAVSDYARVRRVAAQGHRGEQRGVEPAAILVGALQVQNWNVFAVLKSGVGSLQLGIGLADGKPTDAGVDPNVEDVGLFAERRAAAVGADRARRKQRVRRGRAPGLDALALDEGDHGAVELRGDDRPVALLAQEDGDGHVPDLLPADAPVGAGGDHVGDAHLAPGRVPDHLIDLLDGQLAEGGSVPSARFTGVSMPMNHCSVARVMTGLWQRQQCG